MPDHPEALASITTETHALGNAFQHHDLRLMMLEQQMTRLWWAVGLAGVLTGAGLLWAILWLWSP